MPRGTAIARHELESFACHPCGERFELTIDEATRKLGAGRGINRPNCGRLEAVRIEDEFVIGGFARSDSERTQQVDKSDADAPAAPVGGMRRKGGQ